MVQTAGPKARAENNWFIEVCCARTWRVRCLSLREEREVLCWRRLTDLTRPDRHGNDGACKCLSLGVLFPLDKSDVASERPPA
jgi:hypothetical protein